jgi:hypothetical protein
MAATLELVIDELLGTLNSFWQANAQTVSGLSYTPELVWESRRDERPKVDPNRAYADVYIRHNSSGVATLGKPAKYDRYGSVYLNIYAPFVDSSGYAIALRLAQCARDAYEGKRTDPSGLAWFRHCRINEQGRQGPFYQVNLVLDFTWEEVK